MLEKITYKNFDSLLGRFSTAELEGLVQKFPYFQQGHLLLAKKYQLENNPKFDEQLQLAALYTQNRELLYDIFTKPAVEQSVSLVREAERAPEVTEQNIITVEAVSAEQVTKDTPVVTDFMSEEVAMDATSIPEEKSPEEQEPDFTVDIANPENDLTEIVAVEASTETTIDLSEPHTYDEWLKAFANETSVVDRPEQPTIEVAAETTTDEPDELERMILEHAVSTDYMHGLVEEETKYSKGLDYFIQTQIEKHRKSDSGKPTDEAALENEFVTETLAKLYESQRLYHKAIKAYEALTMKFPEKIDLFAARIENLKKLI